MSNLPTDVPFTDEQRMESRKIHFLLSESMTKDELSGIGLKEKDKYMKNIFKHFKKLQDQVSVLTHMEGHINELFAKLSKEDIAYVNTVDEFIRMVVLLPLDDIKLSSKNVAKDIIMFEAIYSTHSYQQKNVDIIQIWFKNYIKYELIKIIKYIDGKLKKSEEILRSILIIMELLKKKW